MLSPPAALLGCQEPQIVHRPPDVHSLDAATEAIELARAVGMTLDPAQELHLELALGERSDGSWAAFEVGDVEPRQNGKGDVIQARELAGLFLFGEQLQIHTAHEFPTANEAFLRMVATIEANPDLERKVLKIRFANGEQGVELRNGARLKYRARTGGAGRGFAGADLVVYDEAYALVAEQIAASLPTLSTGVNPQVWFASSAGLSTSTQLWHLRKRALLGDAGRLAYWEHTAERIRFDPDKERWISDPINEDDEALVALANPAYGYRISADYVAAERHAMSGEAGKFARERLGVFDPLPEDLAAKEPKLPADKWGATVTDDPPLLPPGQITLAFDVGKDGAVASIGIAGGDIRKPYVELIAHDDGTSWLPQELVRLVKEHRPMAVGCNGAGPAGAQVGPVLAAFKEAGLSAELLHQMTAREYQQACGGFYLDVKEGRLTRLSGQPLLDEAGRKAAARDLGDAWAWDRPNETVPISPLVAVTIARALLPSSAPKDEADFIIV